MDKNYLIQLTNNLYQLTLLFPKKEPLRYKMREIAGDIFANLISLPETNSINKHNEKCSRYIGELEVLDGFFEVAKSQNWVPVVEILRIQEEYSRMKAEIKKISKKPVIEIEEKSRVEKIEVKPQSLPQSPQPAYNQRQEKILKILKEKGKAQVWEVKKIFPEVTKRTLRRDFEFLLKRGKIERIGERNETFYQLRSLAP